MNIIIPDFPIEPLIFLLGIGIGILIGIVVAGFLMRVGIDMLATKLIKKIKNFYHIIVSRIPNPFRVGRN